MNNDLISREALKKYARVVFDKDLGRLRVVDVSDIDNAPTVEAYTPEQVKELVELNKKLSEERLQGEWVPVSEKLPEEKINPNTNDFVKVLCSTVFGDVRVYKYGKPMGYSKAHFWDWGEIMDEYVMAAMPLPEPYKEGGKE